MTASAARPALSAEGVAYSYRKDAPLLKDVTAQVKPGSFLAILGVNGCGKSTLMACLDGMLSPKSGVVRLDDSPLERIPREERARRIALVAQHSHANRLTVFDALLLGRKPYVKAAPRDEDFAAVERVIAQLGLESLALRYVDELSGGEYQKMIIGRAFVQETDVLLLDEPTNNLDMANQAEVMHLVRSAVDERGIAAAAVMHDINLALRYCDRFAVIHRGEVAVSGSRDCITPDVVRMVYGVDVDIVEHKGRRVMVAL